MADEQNTPPLGPVAQEFEDTLQSAEQAAFHGTGDGEGGTPVPYDDFTRELKLIMNGFVRSIEALIQKHGRR